MPPTRSRPGSCERARVNVFFAGGGTGGHLYPALNIARALIRLQPQVTPFFIGARRGIEREVLPGSGFPFALLDLHPLYRQRPWANWRTMWGAATAWRELSHTMRTTRPALLVATGGYAAGVALADAALRRIPIVIQEQNSVPGATVRWFAPRAHQLHLGFPEAARLLRTGPATQIFDSGNPIEPPPTIRAPRESAISRWGFDNVSAPTVLVFGGSQGATAINAAVGAWVSSGRAAGLNIIWSTGRAGYESFAALNSAAVKISAYISPMSEAYAAADLAVCRAGAMTTAELLAWGVPPILIPLPTAAADHQTGNALTLSAAGAATMLRQAELSVESLNGAVRALAGDPGALAHARSAGYERARPHSAEVIANQLLMLLNLK